LYTGYFLQNRCHNFFENIIIHFEAISGSGYNKLTGASRYNMEPVYNRCPKVIISCSGSISTGPVTGATTQNKPAPKRISVVVTPCGQRGVGHFGGRGITEFSLISAENGVFSYEMPLQTYGNGAVIAKEVWTEGNSQ